MTDDFKKEYDLVLPLGRFCHCANLLHNYKLHNADSAWDWSGTACEDTIYMRIKGLYKPFGNYFNKRDFVELKGDYLSNLMAGVVYNIPKTNLFYNDSLLSTPHRGYFNKRTATYYIHDFFKNLSFKEQFKEIRKKYMRRYERTVNYVKASDRILLVYMSHVADQKRDLRLGGKNVLKAMRWLRSKYPEKTIDLYMFDHDSKVGEGNLEREILDVGIVRYKSNHDEVFDSNDQDKRHVVYIWMAPKSICSVLEKIKLSDKHRII